MLGSGDKVTVLWDIQEDVTSNDWIGLFLVGESSSGFPSFSFFRYWANFHRWNAMRRHAQKINKINKQIKNMSVHFERMMMVLYGRVKEQ